MVMKEGTVKKQSFKEWLDANSSTAAAELSPARCAQMLWSASSTELHNLMDAIDADQRNSARLAMARRVR